MTKYTLTILAAVALLPMTVSTAQAGRRNLAAAEKTAAPAVKLDLSNFAGWMRSAMSQIHRGFSSSEGPASVVAAVENSPPPAGAVAQGQLSAAPRRTRGANLIVVLLVSKPVVSNQ
jgi:hypothetical protein